MRHDPGEGHADTERVLALSDVARIDARCLDTDPHFAFTRHWRIHLANHEHVAGRALLVIPRCFH
jgi:hypothetical protein